MSTPSSSEVEHTTVRSLPLRSSASVRWRTLRSSALWCTPIRRSRFAVSLRGAFSGTAISSAGSPACSISWAMRSAWLRTLVNTSVERTSCVSAYAVRAHCASGAIAPANGATTSSRISRSPRQSTTAQSRPVPAKYAATRSSGATVAESPTRRSGARVSSASDSSSSARCAPRLLPASACTSSTITVSTCVSFLR